MNLSEKCIVYVQVPSSEYALSFSMSLFFFMPSVVFPEGLFKYFAKNETYSDIAQVVSALAS